MSDVSRPELVQAARDAVTTPLSQTEALAVVNAVLDTIQMRLQNGDQVRLRGFGTFKVTTRKASAGRNPRTGEPISIPEKRVAKFTPAKELLG